MPRLPHLFALTMVYALATTSAADILPGNFLPNPSVELDEDGDGIPDGWLQGGNDPSGDIWDDQRPVSGERNLLLFDSSDSSYTSWYTNVAIPPGTDELQFRWSWSYAFTSENPGDEFRMTIAWRSEDMDIGSNHVVVREDELDYVTEDQFFVVPDGADALRLEFVSAGPQTETGVMYIDDISIAVPGAVLTGDFNENGMLDAPDIDILTEGVFRTNDPIYDLNGDSVLNQDDVHYWIKDLFNSWIGDANVDGEFNSGDLVAVLSAGTYETGVDAVWTTGDFNADLRTNSGDLVAALTDGGYELGPRAATSAIPEPQGLVLLAIGLALLPRGRRRPQEPPR